MKKRKIITVLLLVLCMVLSVLFSGCSSGTPETSSTAAPATEDAKEIAYPEKPITFICQYGAGGGLDITERILAKYLQEDLGVNVVVQNVTGGGGVVGLNAMAASASDGYTLGITFPAEGAVAYVVDGAAYSLDSWDVIGQINFDPNILVVKKGGKFDVPLKDLIAMSEKTPLNFAMNAQWGTQEFVRLYLKNEYGFHSVRVGYDGGAQCVQALLNGDADITILFPSELASYFTSGDFVPVAVASKERFSAFPDCPTFVELGYDKIESFGIRRCLVTPAGVDPAIKAILEASFQKIIADPALVEEFTKAGMSCIPADAATAKDNLFGETQNLIDYITQLGYGIGDIPD
jgi:tripartite-type tricarboxylate transporter receptor subunit TctC